MKNFVSLVMTHFTSSSERSLMMKHSLLSLQRSPGFPMEVIVVDNGGKGRDNELFFRDAIRSGYIQAYVRNQHNMHFGFARNQGIALAHGDYVAVCDDDLSYSPGWLKDCVDVLQAFPQEKIYTTPMYYPVSGFRRYKKGFLDFKGLKIELHMRAGSNCFVIRRKDLLGIGPFPEHIKSGAKWTDRACEAGFLAAIVPGQKVTDMGLRRGCDFTVGMPMSIQLVDGPEVFFNQDSYHKRFPNEVYYYQV